MFDIKAIRDNPDFFDKGWARRGLEPQTPDLLKLDEERRSVQTELQELQQIRNEKSKAIGEAKREGKDAQEAMDAVSAIKNDMTALEERERTIAESLHQRLAALPNLLDDSVPDGADEEDNVEIRKWGEPSQTKIPEHFEIGEALGLMDFETAAKMSGARFVLLKGALARLERALAQFMLDTHVSEHGYTEVSPPLLVKDEALFGTGQLPKFGDDLFRSSDSNHWMIPTSETPLTNIVADLILDEEELPMRVTAHTPNFRKEAGAAGKDTRGMIRHHQFHKVEQVCIVKPEDSDAEHERIVKCAENIMQKLGLPYRVIVLCSGDTGASMAKTYDLEAWLPGQQRYREISSCSNARDFQARRMKARFRKKGKKDTQFVHTLNGSGVAVGRALIAVIENYYNPESKTITIPDVLKPYMGGIEKIG